MTADTSQTVAIIGGGPAGLMAAEVIAGAGHTVTVYERMPSLGRKMLMAGRGGLNLTHSEPLGRFFLRYGPAFDRLQPLICGHGASRLANPRWSVRADGYFHPHSRLHRCCGPGCTGWKTWAFALHCATAGPDGPPTAA